MDNPASVDEEATRELRDIIQEFPASPILHWLYLKGLQNQKSYLFNSALSRAAIGSPNRSQLLEWVGLQQPETEDAKKQRFEFVIPEIEKEPEVEVKEEVKAAPVVTEEKKEEPARVVPSVAPSRAKKKAPADLPDDIKALLEKSKRIRTGYNDGHPSEVEQTKEEHVVPVSKTPEVKIEEPVADLPEVRKEEVKADPVHLEVEEEVFPELVEVSVEPVIEEKVEEVSFAIQEPEEEETYFSIDLDLVVAEESVQEEKIPELVEVENSFSIELEDYSTEEEVVEKDEAEPVDISQNNDADFTSWLKTLKSDEPIEEEEIPALEPVALKEEISFTLETDVVPQESKKIDPVKEKKIELIDKFLEVRPKITPRKEDFSLLNIADNPESDDNQFVTETLAKVYLAQGHLNKAIEAYEILGLKYPEKNTFFADRIRDIKRRK
jgi:hypothetical protein